MNPKSEEKQMEILQVVQETVVFIRKASQQRGLDASDMVDVADKIKKVFAKLAKNSKSGD